MYSECEQTSSGPLPCTYSGQPVTLKDPKSLQILKNYCPDLFEGSNTKTCCDERQLSVMEKEMVLIKQIFSRCPSCLHNFMGIFCQMTCSPNQKTFLKVTSHGKTVRSLDYIISRDFLYRMFNSCKNVELPSSNDKALSIICGRSANECTPENLLDYLGSTSNGRTPFEISFIKTNKIVTIGGIDYHPMNQSTIPCSESCSKHDCGIPKLPKPRPCPDGSCFDGRIRPIYRQEQVVVTRPNNHTVVTHRLPPPSDECMNYTSLFDKSFLHLLLDFQESIGNISVKFENQEIGLEDICYRPHYGSDSCAVFSILEYWQSNRTAIDKIKMDTFGFFILADYLDHFSSCAVESSEIDTVGLNMSCSSSANQAIYPNMVLAGYGGENQVQHFNSSTAFVITYLVQNYQDDRMNDVARAWEGELRRFVQNFRSPNMTVSVNTPSV
ncbi:NPC intracellular cholesterol transporter 1-like [Saccostrea echinata]|uniref:NPC intracellular cholesterol transporter 1-like n=1 Tax=Saccostrea echinata TaxID=191078 RepID=UPI002A833415|nr:NPC intracellular cholesterol transporter 1-like [Saccostrea echinata]